jgi:hypothetical protein
MIRVIAGSHVTAKTIPGEDEESKEVSGPLHVAHVEDLDYDHYVVDGRSVDPESIKTKKTAGTADGMRCLYCGASAPDVDEPCPDGMGARHTLISGADKEFWGNSGGATPTGPAASGQEDAYKPDTLGWDSQKQKVISRRVEAHGFSQDDEVVHCAFCGSGDVWGGSDGSIECNFCGKVFTVQVQPEFNTMPQTVGDQPMGIDGSPDDDGQAMGGDGDAMGTDPDSSAPGLLGDDPGASGGSPEAGGSPEDEETPQNGSSFQASRKKYYLTPDQNVLDEDGFLRHLANVCMSAREPLDSRDSKYGWYVNHIPECACGWKGENQTSSAQAIKAGKNHVAEVHEKGK